MIPLPPIQPALGTSVLRLSSPDGPTPTPQTWAAANSLWRKSSLGSIPIHRRHKLSAPPILGPACSNPPPHSARSPPPLTPPTQRPCLPPHPHSTVHADPRFPLTPKARPAHPRSPIYPQRLCLLNSDFGAAERNLAYAFDHCPALAFTNKRLALRYLVPVRLALGSFASRALLVKYRL
eukprot:scaffold19502_cov105-Isochrysis_galbana.AAC.3